MGDLKYASVHRQGLRLSPPLSPQYLNPFMLPQRSLWVEGTRCSEAPVTETPSHCMDPEVVRGRILAHLSH
jgi:hypothetical protein